MKDLIRIARLAKGFSQEEMADMIGLSQSQFSRIENAEKNVPKERLLHIATLLKIDVKQLLPAEDKNIKGFENLYGRINDLEEEKAEIKRILNLTLTYAAKLDNSLSVILQSAQKSKNFRDFKTDVAVLAEGMYKCRF